MGALPTPRLSPPAAWHDKRHPLGYLLAPLSWLFCAVASLRRLAYRRRFLAARHPGVPVVVVGNITTGGTGKTPLVIRLAGLLREHGFRPGIVTRGYGGKSDHWPRWVEADTDPVLAGDEAVLLARRGRCPVVAGPDRAAAAEELLARTDCNLILSDDGLQHYALERDVEIAVVDGVLGHGNGRCLPAGPLREAVSRLATVDLVVVNHGFGDQDNEDPGKTGTGAGLPGPGPAASPKEYAMALVPGDPLPVVGGKPRPVAAFRGIRVHAVCGIGHPDRFFATLRGLGLRIEPHAFPDHHAFAPEDVAFGDGLPVLMTEKDAVKCRMFAGSNHWYLPVEAVTEPEFGARLLTLLGEVPVG
uniref:Tetraacyldisaccharide 4'-kinase n=1 Tax=Candidatus Kentrum sp. DK TaxID=2126562 RepID=A0A450SZC5_9GAMM|nr:MAG: lipid-A-disaccharide kinase [Candidatus Kentron sp. DK]